jgi:intracellular sulfur oxidation DsrE/DsrF family protein
MQFYNHNNLFMKKYFLFVCIMIFLLPRLFSQTIEVKDIIIQHVTDSINKVKDVIIKQVTDSIMAARKDSIKWAKFESMAYFPLINAGKFSGVLPVVGVDEIPSPKREYKLLFEFTLYNKDSTHEKIDPGLTEIARILNLHVASGIPVSHTHPVIVVHGAALYAIQNNELYQGKFKKDNPNSKVIHDLMKNGARFIACGQAMNFFDVKKEELFPGVKVSLTAQTVLSNYIGQGYVWYGISEENK